MGLETRLVISDERHYGPFLCAICRNLCGLDALVTTCSHCFCRTCLSAWLDRPSGGRAGAAAALRCPTCNRDLAYESRRRDGSGGDGPAHFGSVMMGGRTVDARPLSSSQPLAHRLLGRVRVSCPLSERHGCPWRGDYGDLQGHLLSATAHLQGGVPSGRLPASPVLTPMSARVGDGDVGDRDGEAVGDGGGGEERVEVDNSTASTGPRLPAAGGGGRRRRALAESFKSEANAKFSTGNYREARDLYAKALSVVGKPGGDDEEEEDRALAAALLSNRAAAHLKLGDLGPCVADCDAAIALDGGYAKAYVRRSKALVQLGKFDEAVASLRPVGGGIRAPDPSSLTSELRGATRIRDGMARGAAELGRGEYAVAKATFGSLLRETGAARVVAAAARADLGLGLTDSALRLSLGVIRSDQRNAEGYEIRGHCMYLMGDFDSALPLLREAIRLDPDGGGAKAILRQCRNVGADAKKARDAAFRRDFGAAVELFTTALDAAGPLPRKAPLYCALHAERGEAQLRLKRYEEALRDSTLALAGREDHVQAWLVKTNAYHGLGRHEEALEELGEIMRNWGSGDSSIRGAYEKADFEVRKMRRPDFYQLLGVSPIASEMEIKKQYKVKAMELHPDRFGGKDFTDQDRQVAEEKFKLLGEGLEILCDEFSRKLYDEGYDQEAIRERISAAQQAAHRKGGNYHHR